MIDASRRAKARVAPFEGMLIFTAMIGVAVQAGWHLRNTGAPVFEAMGFAALANLGLNGVCPWLPTAYRHGGINMASARECSLNDTAGGNARKSFDVADGRAAPWRRIRSSRGAA